MACFLRCNVFSVKRECCRGRFANLNEESTENMITSPARKGICARGGQRAFTLSELLAVTLVVSVLAMLLVPAHSASRTKARVVRCMDNLSQLMNGMLMYTHDYHDLLPPNPDDGTILAGYTWCTGIAGIGGSAEFNPDLLANP